MKKLSSVSDYESCAYNNFEESFRSYMMKGSQNNVTLDANVNAYKQYRIIPRYMRDVSKTNLEVSIFGDTIKMPLGVSPTAMHGLYHPNGELETSRGVSQFNTIMIVSCGPNFMIEEIAAKQPNLIKWFQLYIFEDRRVTTDLVKRAQKLGFKALVLTIDRPVLSVKFNAIDPVFKKKLSEDYDRNLSGGENSSSYTSHESATDVTWNDLKWLKSQTRLPVVVKGVMSATDARLAVNNGADAVLVSNHGGRQLDDLPASLEVLPEVMAEVGKEVPVLIDGGIRTGNDVFKALALGATAAFIGRPILYGLYHSGSDGVKSILDIFYTELETTMKLSGCTTINHITHSYIEHIDQLRNRHTSKL